MINRNPQLSAIALLVRKFGNRIAGGGYEVEVPITEMMEMSPYGTFQEVPSLDQRTVKWQYFPNVTIDAEGHVVPDSVTPEGVIRSGHIWEENLGTRGANCALCYVEQTNENRDENCSKRPEYERQLAEKND